MVSFCLITKKQFFERNINRLKKCLSNLHDSMWVYVPNQCLGSDFHLAKNANANKKTIACESHLKLRVGTDGDKMVGSIGLLVP